MKIYNTEVTIVKINRTGVTDKGREYIDFRIQENQSKGGQLSPLWLNAYAMDEMCKAIEVNKTVILNGELKGNNYTNSAGIRVNQVKLFVNELLDCGKSYKAPEYVPPTKEEQEALPFD